MTLKQYLALMAIGTIFCWGIWTFVLFTINPTHASIFGFVFFYLSLLLSLVGTFAVIGLIIRLLKHQDEIIFRHVKQTFRRGILLGSLIVAALLFKSFGLLYWWTTLFLIIVVASIEALSVMERRVGLK
ncbi:MAG: hypothetical protein HW383_334 [Candidatus Magasanikbacteria bacterium]|nr:hypothetical protein [Candidatus Magasanikbacteria bacterium]